MHIYIITFGDVEKRALLCGAHAVKHAFRLNVRISSVSFPISQAYNPYRGQYDAELVLQYLSRLDYPDVLRLIALVSFDLYVEGLNFVFGLAQHGGRNAVVSIHRLRTTDEELFFERVKKELLHELGHTFGLGHCQDRRCVMSFSNSVFEVDIKGSDFCPRCKSLLRAY